MISEFFIRRPIFATVLAIVITIVGGLSLVNLPIATYPDITPPTVVVAATYPGASADVLADTVAAPIEEQVNGVEDMLYMSSTSSSNGTYSLTITFEVGTDLDEAAVRVQNRVAIAEPLLPEEVQRQGVVTQKRSTSFVNVVQFFSPNDRYDDLFLSNYVTLRVLDEIKRVPGVGDASVNGARRFSMRVWLDPGKMQARNITTSDVLGALREQNVQVAAGQIGQPPTEEAQPFQLNITTLGRLSTPEQFGDIIVKSADAAAGAQLVRVRDVARVELGAQDYSAYSMINGQTAVSMLVYQLPGANALDVARGVQERLDALAREFPEGMEYVVGFDLTLFVVAAIEEVVETLVIAFLLVFFTVYIFLQDLRATFIPTIAIPVSIIGTFAVMFAMGFSINMMTLFGLILAIGIVVDDAIIVVENASRNIEESGLNPVEASIRAMREVTGPIVATTLVLFAVFGPAAFFPGLSGQLYRQFSLTIAFSTLFSAIVALTLSPALCALFLRKTKTRRFFLFRGFNWGFGKITNGYTRFVAMTARRAIVMMLFAGIIFGIAYYRYSTLPTGFLPQEDQGYMIAVAQLPDGASIDRTGEVAQQMTQIALDTPGVANVVAIVGLSIFDQTNTSNAVTMFLPLKPWHDRHSEEESLMSILGHLNMKYAEIPEAMAFVIPPTAIPGLGVSGGWEMQVQDRGGSGLTELEARVYELRDTAAGQPSLTNINTTFRANVPQLFAEVDRTKAKSMNVSLSELFGTMQAFLGSAYVNDFNLFNRTFQVRAQAESAYRLDADDIERLRVRNGYGEMVPLGTMVDIQETTGPQIIRRYNLYPAAQLTGQAQQGYSSGAAMDLMEQVAAQVLPQTMGIEWSGASYQERRVGGEAGFIFALAVILVFLVLAAQYESWGAPLAVILAVPLAVLGAAFAVGLRGMDNNVYTQVGLILLIGLASKNAILIVEFAREIHAHGKPVLESAIEAARLRLRPIIMTSFAFILGCVPLYIATGAGAASRQALGTVVVGGMITGTLLTALFVPSYFTFIQGITERLKRMRRGHAGPSTPPPPPHTDAPSSPKLDRTHADPAH